MSATYTIYASKQFAEFEHNYGGVTDSITLDSEDVSFDGESCEAYTFVVRDDPRCEERLVELLKSDRAVVTFGLDPVSL